MRSKILSTIALSLAFSAGAFAECSAVTAKQTSVNTVYKLVSTKNPGVNFDVRGKIIPSYSPNYYKVSVGVRAVGELGTDIYEVLLFRDTCAVAKLTLKESLEGGGF